MRSFFKNVLANIVAIGIIFFLFFIFFISMVFLGSIGEKNVKVKKNSILTLDFKTQIIDSQTENQGGVFNFQDKNKSVLLYDMLDAIKKAKTDDKIKGISIETDQLTAGLTQLDDLRAALEDFKKSGKFVYAYGNVVSQGTYYLGSVADHYYLNPSGGVDLKGMSTEVVLFKDFMEKYGINVEVIRHGKFKAAVEPFMKSEISSENREQLTTLLNDIWNVTSNKIAVSRKMDGATFKTVVDSLYGMIPELSFKNKLTDQLIQKSEYDDLLKKKLNISKDDDLNKISISKYVDSYQEDNVEKSDQIAVLYASGEINNGEGYDNIYAENFKKQIKKLAENEDVKAVVLRINSPGGSANASDEILFELQQLKKKKPLIVSFGDYAASGGYYIAMAGDKIYSEPNTITGSIGVFGMIPYFKDIATKNGIKSDVIETNANANMISTLHGVSPGGVVRLTQSVEQTYKRFVYFVTQNRKKSFEQIDAIGGGRVWSGTRAKDLGLVDELGSLNDAIMYAASKTNLKKYNVAAYPKKMSKFEQIFNDMDEDEISAKIIQRKIGKENYKVFEQMTNPKLQNQVMMKAPFQINIQ